MLNRHICNSLRDSKFILMSKLNTYFKSTFSHIIKQLLWFLECKSAWHLSIRSPIFWQLSNWSTLVMSVKEAQLVVYLSCVLFTSFRYIFNRFKIFIVLLNMQFWMGNEKEVNKRNFVMMILILKVTHPCCRRLNVHCI